MSIGFFSSCYTEDFGIVIVCYPHLNMRLAFNVCNCFAFFQNKVNRNFKSCASASFITIVR
ncbi:hypothetical protein [Peptostreptococcus sp. MV1]|uniref:hypothetical protein n=1 Tax=Peptostreptococcus sp. MV1 TaxID=1219626 RepID=UPI0012EB913E|nr:hypothetical protein [Peptostreptococcus sp. MV1]